MEHDMSADLIATDVHGYAGAGTIAFTSYMPHGNGKRKVTMQVSPQMIIALARSLLLAGYTMDHDCPHWHAGHAVWHMQHLDRSAPCEMCHPVADPARTFGVEPVGGTAASFVVYNSRDVVLSAWRNPFPALTALTNPFRSDE